MSELLREGILILSAAGAVVCGLLAWRISRGNPQEWERNRRLVGSLRKTIRGEISTVHDGRRDYRISAGIAVDRKGKKWVEQGRLSAEAISAALRPPTSP
jgi:hypothetical protein